MVDFNRMTEDELDQWLNQNDPERQTLLRDAGEYLKENLDLPVGITGALAGAAAGSAVPVVGTIAGGIIGGALGTGIGSAASDVIEDGEIDALDVTKSVGMSVGIDLATFGAGKLLKPLAQTLGITPKSLLGASEKKGLELSDELIDINKLEAGSLDSIRATQQFLESEGGSLSAAQTGQASFFRRLFEGIGDIGILSGRKARNRIATNNKIILDSVDGLSNRAGSDGITSENIGEELFGIVQAGKQAATKLYGEGLDNIVKESGKTRINTGAIKGALMAFVKNNEKDLGSELVPSVKKQINQLLDDVTNSPDVASLLNKNVKDASVESLISFQKRVTNMIDEAMPNSANANPVAVRQLTQLSQAVKRGINKSIKRRSPNLASAYNELNKTYGATMQGLLPRINSRFATAAKNSDYHAIGNMLLNNNNVSKIKAMMNSVDTAYQTAAKAGLKPEGAAKTALQAKRKISEAYMQNVFKTMTRESDPTKFGNFARNQLTAESLAKSKAILNAKDFGRYKMLLNVISDNSKGVENTMFGLAFRQRETAGVAGLLGAGGAGAVFSSIPMLAGILVLPEVLGRIATNSKAVNKLISLNKNAIKFKSPENLAYSVNDIIKTAFPNEEERKELGFDIQNQ